MCICWAVQCEHLLLGEGGPQDWTYQCTAGCMCQCQGQIGGMPLPFEANDTYRCPRFETLQEQHHVGGNAAEGLGLPIYLHIFCSPVLMGLWQKSGKEQFV